MTEAEYGQSTLKGNQMMLGNQMRVQQQSPQHSTSHNADPQYRGSAYNYPTNLDTPPASSIKSHAIDTISVQTTNTAPVQLHGNASLLQGY